MNLPIEMFVIGLGISLMFVLLGFFRQIPYMLIIGGMLLLVFAVTTDIIILSHEVVNGGSEVITQHYNVSFENDQIEIDINETAIAEYVSNGSSILVGDIVNCIDIAIVKTEAETLTGNVVVGIMDDAASITEIWATVPANDFPDTPNQEPAPFSTYCFDDYTIVSGDRIGIKYTESTDDANLIVRDLQSGVNFDGITTRSQKTNSSGMWEDSHIDQDEDLTMRLYFVGVGEGEEVEQVTYQFSEFPKVLFALFGVLIMLMSLMIWRDGI